jgi:hypothetical protein
LKEGLSQFVRSTSDPERRVAHLQSLLLLLHEARRIDTHKFLQEAFLPWVALKNRAKAHKGHIADQLARLQSLPEGSEDEAALWVNLYRNLVSDLFDPYATLLVACCQFIDGSFVSINDANVGLSERSKTEYVTARMRALGDEVDFFSGYSAEVRNAISHAGSDGVTFEGKSILFRNIRRGSNARVDPVRWSVNELALNCIAVMDFSGAVDSAVEIFGFDCDSLFTQEWTTFAQLLALAFTASQRRDLGARREALFLKIRTDERLSPSDRLTGLSKVLFYECGVRQMPITKVLVPSSVQQLSAVVPLSGEIDSDRGLIRRAMELTRYLILARTIFGKMYRSFAVFESEEPTTTRLSAELSGDLLDEYIDERAGLVDFLSEGLFKIGGAAVSIEIDKHALETAEDRTLGEFYPRRGRPSI